MKIVKRHEPELTPRLWIGDNGRMPPPVSEIEAIAERLRELRAALGDGEEMRPAELCRITGIKPNTYSQWEDAKGRPRLDEAKKLCLAFGVTLDWIYFGDRSGLPHRIASRLPQAAERA